MDYEDIDNTWQHDWQSGSKPDSDLSQNESTLSSQSAGSISGLPTTTTWNRPGYDVRKHLRVQRLPVTDNDMVFEDYVVRESWSRSECDYLSPRHVTPIAQAVIDMESNWSADDVEYGYETGPLEALPSAFNAIDDLVIADDPCKRYELQQMSTPTYAVVMEGMVATPGTPVMDEPPLTPAAVVETSLSTNEDDLSHESVIV